MLQHIDRMDKDGEAIIEVIFVFAFQAFAHRGKSVPTFQSILNNGLKNRKHPHRHDGSGKLDYL